MAELFLISAGKINRLVLIQEAVEQLFSLFPVFPVYAVLNKGRIYFTLDKS